MTIFNFIIFQFYNVKFYLDLRNLLVLIKKNYLAENKNIISYKLYTLVSTWSTVLFLSLWQQTTLSTFLFSVLTCFYGETKC